MRKSSFKEEEKVISKWEKDTYVYYFHYFIIYFINVMTHNKSTKYS